MAKTKSIGFDVGDTVSWRGQRGAQRKTGIVVKVVPAGKSVIKALASVPKATRPAIVAHSIAVEHEVLDKPSLIVSVRGRAYRPRVSSLTLV